MVINSHTGPCYLHPISAKLVNLFIIELLVQERKFPLKKKLNMWANFTALHQITFLPLTFVWDKLVHYVASRTVDTFRETKTMEGLVDDLITKSGTVPRKHIDDSLGRKKDNLTENMDEKFARQKDDLKEFIHEEPSILLQIHATLSKLNETITQQHALLVELVQKLGPIQNRREHVEGAGTFTQSLIMNKTENSLMIRER